MEILNTYVCNDFDEVELFGGPPILIYRRYLQYTAAPTTPEEIDQVGSGSCPKCGEALICESEKWCVRDQIKWVPGSSPA